MTALEHAQHARLTELATQLGDAHAACETALSDALGHAFRAGDLLLEAKELLPYGAWGRWLAEHFAGSERTARGYMQLAREPERRPVADVGVRAALATLAAPLEGSEAPAEEPEVVDAEPVEVPDQGPSVFDLLRAEGGLEAAEAELREKEAHLAKTRFPRAGVERATLRQIRQAARRAEGTLGAVANSDVSDWSVAEALAGAARHFRDASDLATELRAFVRSRGAG